MVNGQRFTSTINHHLPTSLIILPRAIRHAVSAPARMPMPIASSSVVMTTERVTCEKRRSVSYFR